ncbi:MAG: MFS transporter [Haloarculaceae archaeon]
MNAAGREDPSVRYVVASLVAGVFFGGLGGGVAFPTLPTLGPLLGISPFVVGLILSVNRFTRLVMNTPAGQVLDRVGTRRPMIVGFVFQGLVPFGYILGLHADRLPVGSATVFLLSRSLWGFGSAFVFVGAFSTITHVTTPENRGKWIGYMRGGQSLGFPTGLVVGGLLTDAYGYDLAFAVAGVAGLLAAVVAFLVLPDVSPDVGASPLRELPSIVRADPRIAAVGTVNLVVRFLFAGVLLSTVVLYAGEYEIEIGLLSATGVSGVVMAISVLGASVTTVLVGRYSDEVSNRALVTIPAVVVLAAGFVLLAFLPTLLGIVVAVALIGIGVGGSNPPLMAYLGDISPSDDVGKLGGVYNVFGDLGSTLGPLVALPLVERVGFAAEYLACAVLALGVGVLVSRTLLGDTSPTTAVPADD